MIEHPLLASRFTERPIPNPGMNLRIIDGRFAHDGDGASLTLANAQLLARVDQALRATGYLSLRELKCTVGEGLVTLRGRLPSYYMKQVAHVAVRAVPGVGDIH